MYFFNRQWDVFLNTFLRQQNNGLLFRIEQNDEFISLYTTFVNKCNLSRFRINT